jgi:hypothetical protein
MTQEKVFPEYIAPWLDYHRRLGVDAFYIYDNHSPVDLKAAHASRTDVEVVYWPWVKSQLQAQNHFLVLAKRRCEWVVMIDVDEYVMVDDFSSVLLPRPEAHLRFFLRYMRGRRYEYVQLPEVAMGSSGLHYPPKDVAMPEAYTHRRDDLFLTAGKFAAAVDCTTVDSQVHNVTLVYNARPWFPARPHLAINATQPYGHGIVVHFKHRSWEDWVRKSRAGRNSIMVKDRTLDGADVKVPDPHHLDMSTMEEYTAFRTYWRSVMAQKTPDCPHLVYFEGGRRCVGMMDRSESSGSCQPVSGKVDLQCEYSQDYMYKNCEEGRRTNFTY